ncbi:MAG: 50S ribosomal protein L13 [Dehalococcoidales bacterium]
MKTYSVKASEIKRDWHVIDASDRVLGKLATEAAQLIMGKHKPTYTRHLDVGDYVVVTNANKIVLTGKKREQKVYHRHTGYPGGLKTVAFEKMIAEKPAWVIEHAVKGMLPKNRMGAAMLKKLKVYTGDAHPHRGQTEQAAE